MGSAENAHKEEYTYLFRTSSTTSICGALTGSGRGIPEVSGGRVNVKAGSWVARGGEFLSPKLVAALGEASDPDRLRFRRDPPGSSSAEANEDVETLEKGGGMGEAACDGLLDGVCTLPGDGSRIGVIPCISSATELCAFTCC